MQQRRTCIQSTGHPHVRHCASPGMDRPTPPPPTHLQRNRGGERGERRRKRGRWERGGSRAEESERTEKDLKRTSVLAFTYHRVSIHIYSVTLSHSYSTTAHTANYIYICNLTLNLSATATVHAMIHSDLKLRRETQVFRKAPFPLHSRTLPNQLRTCSGWHRAYISHGPVPPILRPASLSKFNCTRHFEITRTIAILYAHTDHIWYIGT